MTSIIAVSYTHLNYEERANWNKAGNWSVSDKAREYVKKIDEQEICPLGEERTKALNEAFIEVCQDAGLTKETAEDLIKTYNEA